MNLVYGTPIQAVQVGRLLVWVKRDDLANGGDPDAPALGKMRGLLDAIRASGRDTKVVGAVDRKPSSRNSWATAYLCRELGLQCHAFFSEVGSNQQRAIDLGAAYEVLPGLELEALYATAQRSFYLQHSVRQAYLPIDDCQAPALVDDAQQEVLRSSHSRLKVDTVVIPTGSGGLAIGVMRGLLQLGLRPRIVLHIGGSRRSEDYVNGIVDGAGLRREFPRVRVVSGRVASTSPPPFPCNITYEVPAWDWMLNELDEGTGQSILFWNAGG